MYAATTQEPAAVRRRANQRDLGLRPHPVLPRLLLPHVLLQRPVLLRRLGAVTGTRQFDKRDRTNS